MSKEFSLISTELEIGFDKNKKKILAGNWCFQNIRKKSNAKFLIVENFWNNKKIFDKDYIYIKKLLKKTTVSITNYLNLIHKSNFSNKFWKILILPWLTIYLPAYYFRWKIVQSAIKTNFFVNFYDLQNLKSDLVPLDSYDFHKKIQNDQSFNYFIFRKIIFYVKDKKKIKIIKKKTTKISVIKKEEKKSNPLKFFLKKIINILFLYLFSFNKIFLEKSIFRKIDNIKINFFLKQLPTYPYDMFNNVFGFKDFYENKLIDLKKRNIAKFNLKHENDFEKFLNHTIAEDIPVCFVEGFEQLYNFAKKIRIKPKKIVSSYYHYFNELFKVWVAHLRENKVSKFYTVTHGGGGFLKKSSSLNFEKEIADKQIVWYKSNSQNEIQLPASKFITTKKNTNSKFFISYIEGPTHLFPSRIGYSTIGNENTSSYGDFLKFYRNINFKNKKNIIYLPKKEHNINASKYLINHLRKDQIKKPNSFNKYNQRSKINIISYPQTTFCESIQTTPTILIYEKNKWEFDDRFKSIYQELIKNKILFHDPVEAAKHVNEVSENIDNWWAKNSVQKTKNSFLNNISLVSNNSIKIWVNRLKTL